MNNGVNLLSYGIKLKKKELSTNLIDIDKIKSAVTNATEETDLVVSRFARAVVIVAPTSQITITIEKGEISITNGSTEINAESTQKLAQITRAIDKGVKETLTNFIYSYKCILELSEPRVMAPYLNTAKMLESGLIADAEKMVNATFNWGEDTDAGRFTTLINPKVDDNYENTTQVYLHRALRVKSGTLPELTDLSTNLISYYEDCKRLKDGIDK